MDFERVAKLAGIVSTAAAVVSLAISANSIRADLRSSAIKEWQEVTVFSIVVDAGTTGIALQQIQQKFQLAAPDFADVLPTKEISTQALKRTVLSLLSKRAIAVRTDGMYASTMDGGIPGMATQMQTAVRMQDVGSSLIAMVTESSGKYSPVDIKNLLKSRFTFSDEEFSILVNNMVTMGWVRLDANGHLVTPATQGNLVPGVPGMPKK